MIDAYAFAVPRQPGERRIERHQRMVDALPATGGTIIVVTNEVGRELMRGIRHCRGFAVRKHWRFIAVRSFSDCDKLEGLRGQVLVDWTFAEFAKPAAVERVKQMIAAIAAIYPA